jgi:hypothetical protein
MVRNSEFESFVEFRPKAVGAGGLSELHLIDRLLDFLDCDVLFLDFSDFIGDAVAFSECLE